MNLGLEYGLADETLCGVYFRPPLSSSVPVLLNSKDGRFYEPIKCKKNGYLPSMLRLESRLPVKLRSNLGAGRSTGVFFVS